MKTQLLTSSACRFIEAVTAITTSLLLTPFLIENLGTEDYGLWILILSILGWGSVFSLGLPWAVQRSLTIALENADTAKVNQVFSCGLLVFTILGFVAALGMIILAFFPGVLNISQGTLFTHSLLLLSIKVFWDFIMDAFYGFFSGLLRFDIDANITTVSSILKTLLTFFLLKEMHIYGALLAVMVSDIFLHGFQIYFAKKLFPALKFKMSYIEKAELLNLIHFAKHVVAMSIARILYTKSDPIIVTQLFNLSSVALYSIPSRLCAHVTSLAASVINVTQPVFTKKHAKNEDMQDVLLKVININLFISCLLYLPLLALSEPFIVLWVGDEFQDTATIVSILVFSLLCQAISKPIQDVLLAQANHRLLTLVNLAGALTNISLSIYLGQLFGLVGVAMGVAIGFFLSDFCLHLLLLLRYNKFRVGAVYLKFVQATLLLYGIGYGMKYVITMIDIQTWPSFVLHAALIALLSFLANWYLLLLPDLRGKIQQTAGIRLKQLFNN